jgi:hypothetical protein
MAMHRYRTANDCICQLDLEAHTPDCCSQILEACTCSWYLAIRSHFTSCNSKVVHKCSTCEAEKTEQTLVTGTCRNTDHKFETQICVWLLLCICLFQHGPMRCNSRQLHYTRLCLNMLHKQPQRFLCSSKLTSFVTVCRNCSRQSEQQQTHPSFMPLLEQPAPLPASASPLSPSRCSSAV